jgi:exonuclease III
MAETSFDARTCEFGGSVSISSRCEQSASKTAGRDARSGCARPASVSVIARAIGGLIVGCLYLPNSNPAPGPKFDYKLRWFKPLVSCAQSLLNNGAPVGWPTTST